MAQEKNQLLLKDLCARLPYGVKVRYHYKRNDKVIDEDRELDFSDVETLKYNNENTQDDWCEIFWKPYLRPMSSMTEDEWQIYDDFNDSLRGEEFIELIDWMNSRHLDYRGLIEKGLALEAPKDMYN